MKLGDSVQGLSETSPVRDWIGDLEVAPEKLHRDLVSLPDGKPKQIEISEVADYLFDRGVADSSIKALIEDLGALQRIASWYGRSGTEPSERETVAYLAVPLLRAWGWTPQRMAVEWNRIDIALFGRPPREDSNLAVVVEAKKRNNACFTAKGQARDYAIQTGREECRRLIVTEGIRYGVYFKDKADQYRLMAYLNINRMVDSYPILNCSGAAEALWLISSDWTGEALE